MDYSLAGSSVHGIFQARVLEWVAISFSRETILKHVEMLVGQIYRSEGRPRSWWQWGQDMTNTFKEDRTAPGVGWRRYRYCKRRGLALMTGRICFLLLASKLWDFKRLWIKRFIEGLRSWDELQKRKGSQLGVDDVLRLSWNWGGCSSLESAQQPMLRAPCSSGSRKSPGLAFWGQLLKQIY